jgi:hypothetical protein
VTRLNDQEVGGALEKIQFHQLQGSSIQRAEKAYLNFLMIHGIGQEEELRYSQLHEIHWQEIEGLDGPQHFDDNDPLMQRVNQVEILRLRLESLIRAIYEAASVVVGIVSAEAQRDPAVFDSSLKKFARSNPALLAQVDTSAVLAAWSVTEYRNKLISHHDFCRSYAFKSGGVGCRMCPTGPGVFSVVTHDHLADTDRLWNLYSAGTTKANEQNIHERRRLLFHAVPVIQNGVFNPDRRGIDTLVERYGIDSATLPEISDAVRTFVLAMAGAL